MPNTGKFADQLKLQLPAWMNSVQLTGFSKEFFELVRDIGEAKSKEEEEKTIKNEAQRLKVLMAQADANKRMKEYLIRTVYCVMLGHDVPFAYFHAIAMTQDPKIYNKRTAFLAVSLCLPPNHELLILVVNSIQKGLDSSNFLDICAALIALCKLISTDTIPLAMPAVVKLLQHGKAAVRKKAVMAIHKFWLLSPESIAQLGDKLRVVLCDRDPSVMAASLCLFLDLARTQSTEFKDLVPSFVSILKQVAENRLPRSYEYHSVPAPWIQINLLKLLALFGANDQAVSENMFEVLHQVMQKAERHKNNAGFAVLYECIRTVISIRSTPELLEAAAQSIGEFLKFRNHNLKYLGITALASIVKIAPRFVTPHQLDIIECLESTDESLKRKTLDLLYRMTNTKNVVATTAKLIEYLQHTVATDEHVRAELVSRICELAERYAPTNNWYIDTMSVMLHVGGDLVKPEVAHNLIRLIAQGSGESEEADIQLRQYAVGTFLKSIERGGSVLPDIEVNVICWVVGEYGYLANAHGIPLDTVISLVSDLMERPHEDPSTRAWILTALLKLIAQLQTCPPQVMSLVDKYSRSRHLDSQLRALEFRALVHLPHIMEEVLPEDASCEDIEVDPRLPFLDVYVKDAIAKGARPYIPPSQRKSAPGKQQYEPTKKEWNFSYPAPQAPTTQVPLALPAPTSSPATPAPVSIFAGTATSQPFTPSNTSPAVTTSQLKPSSSVWTKEGFQGKAAPPPKASAVTQNIQSSTPAYSFSKAPSAPAKKLNENQEKLAFSLFSGLSVGGDTQDAGNVDKFQPRPRSPPKVDLTRPKTPPKAETPKYDLTPSRTGGTKQRTPSTSASAAPSLAPTPSAGSSQDLLIDIFGDLSLPSSPTPTQHQAPVTSPPVKAAPKSQFTLPSSTPTTTSAPAYDDLLSLDMAPSSSTKAHTPASLLDNTESHSVPHSSGGEGLLAPTAPLCAQVTANDNFDLSNLSHTPFMWSLLDGSPTSGTNQSLCGDANLRVSYTKVMKQDHALLVFFLSNASAGTITDVNLDVNVPDHFSAEDSADNVVRINFTNTIHTFSVSSIATHITIVAATKLRYRKHGFSLSVSGNVKYRAPAANATTKGKESSLSSWQIPIEINDMLRPITLNTDAFGKQWAAHTMEKKARFTPSTPYSSAALLLEAVCKGLNIKLVQLIGNEGIAAGQLINGDMCLMHALVVGLAVDITIRTKDKSYTEVVSRQLSKIIR